MKRQEDLRDTVKSYQRVRVHKKGSTKEAEGAAESHFVICVRCELLSEVSALPCSIYSSSLRSTIASFIFNVISDTIEALDNS